LPRLGKTHIFIVVGIRCSGCTHRRADHHLLGEQTLRFRVMPNERSEPLETVQCTPRASACHDALAARSMRGLHSFPGTGLIADLPW